MTLQEQSMIDGLIDRVRNTKLPSKDQDADRRLQQGLGVNPDALYILAQTVLGQSYSLQEAAAQVKQLRAENDELRQRTGGETGSGQGSSSLLPGRQGSGGTAAAEAPSSYSPQPSAGTGQGYANEHVPYQPVSNPGYGQPQPGYGQAYQPQSGYGQAYPPQPGYGSGPVYGQMAPGYPPPTYPAAGYPVPVYPASPMGGGFGMGGGGFLQGALQTAAGVAAGEMLVQGVEGIVHDFERPHGESDREFGGGFGDRPGETIVNNYYGDSPEQRESGLGRESDLGAVNYDAQHDASRESQSGEGFLGGDAGSGFGSGGSDAWQGSGEQPFADADTGGFDANATGGDDAGWGGDSGSDDSQNDFGSDDAGGFDSDSSGDFGSGDDQS